MIAQAVNSKRGTTNPARPARLAVKMTQDELSQLHELAERSGETMSFVVRHALRRLGGELGALHHGESE